ncbi:hypothetical protein BCR43DRAFT_499203 [Syncephalastrum racemosum]|uniref:Uncharacterized protein n=1 Tax=Syncephalastrum racemosum TaxID=13706 RepID=A0A1X2GZX2_SYNRA|nr:hypothetical protein BCR43DRAFT_499203 [Syncephalastrum racemosum]
MRSSTAFIFILVAIVLQVNARLESFNKRATAGDDLASALQNLKAQGGVPDAAMCALCKAEKNDACLQDCPL